MPGPGDGVGGYELLEFVNSDPTGAVYRARDTRLGRLVALRIVAPELVDDPIVRARLNRETTALAQLNHPNVPPIYGAEETDDTIIIATQWVDGPRLDALVAEQGPLEPRRAVRLVTQVAAALQMAHRLRLVHRAVTPAHVLVTPEDHAYLTDFGVARRHGEVVGLTDPGALAATLDAAAPEVIRGTGGTSEPTSTASASSSITPLPANRPSPGAAGQPRSLPRLRRMFPRCTRVGRTSPSNSTR